MRNRFSLALLSIILVGVFAALNWAAIAAPTIVSLGVVSFEAPLGMVLLGVTVFLFVIFLVYMAVWQGQILMETRRHQKELHDQRALADQAEASRFTDLKVAMLAEFEKLAAQVQQGQSAASRELREQINSLAAMLGEMDERNKGRSADRM